ncbi:histidine kinase [Acidovorax sp. SRB_14]|uniref:CBS domain-containing protein n=1 Tax=Acidovorax sp. SRB_14 TaxID=1962699 RepID=UPI001565C594|nr:CBS domain-containing protein [Acidovorax sp. SRB_14]NMM80339.1 histidine kinase [Acidovorax sp. SRB_14]
MFFVFGPSGQMYRGGSEKLSQVAPVRRVQRPQALRAGRVDVPAPGAEAAPGHAPASIHLRAQDAMAAYAQTVQGPQEARRPLTRVRDVMTAGALTVSPDARAEHAWQQLAQHGIAQAPVVDTQGQVVGLLLRADLAPPDLLPQPGAVGDAVRRARRPVAEVMVSPVPTVSQDAELRRVASVLLDTGLPGLPVTDAAGVLSGFISRTDILRAVAADPPLDLWS